MTVLGDSEGNLHLVSCPRRISLWIETGQWTKQGVLFFRNFLLQQSGGASKGRIHLNVIFLCTRKYLVILRELYSEELLPKFDLYKIYLFKKYLNERFLLPGLQY